MGQQKAAGLHSLCEDGRPSQLLVFTFLMLQTHFDWKLEKGCGKLPKIENNECAKYEGYLLSLFIHLYQIQRI